MKANVPYFEVYPRSALKQIQAVIGYCLMNFTGVRFMSKNTTFVLFNHLTSTIITSSDSNATGLISVHIVIMQTYSYAHLFKQTNQVQKPHLYALQ
jgi:hypothetical protein